VSGVGGPLAALDHELRKGTVEQVKRLLDVGRPDDARRALAPLLSAHPDDVELLVLAARVEDGAGAEAESRRLIGEALSRDPNHRLGRLLHFEHLVADHRHADAEQVILSLLREMPDNAALIAVYARLMLEALRLEKARALADEALRIAPDDSRAQLIDALLHVVAGDDARASGRVAEMIARDPEAMSVARTAIVVFASGHRPGEALEIARSVLRAEPDDAGIVDTIIELRLHTHPAMSPYRPLLRYGWTASAAIWGLGAVAIRGLAGVSAPASLAFAAIWLTYVIGSWVVPPLLRRHLRRAGA